MAIWNNMPLLNSETRSSPVDVYPEVNKILVRDTGIDKCTVKSYMFDKVFGPEATQADIYAEVVAPLIQEVILGFNCTILAYGQTGTGKTFTIEGGGISDVENKLENSSAGIIPRSMQHLLEECAEQNSNFKICVSFLELYNEEIFDLLSKTDDLFKLKMFDNSSRKGSVIVQGLQVVPVASMEDVYAILEKGFKKRRKAATLLNKASSRSHTIFSIIINVNETSSTLKKVRRGKLNLVDLAGSENVGRSGAIDKRAREAGNINQSLLALGRVITSLCEKATHIPYRESKLTRLLQDSLGGQTKTAVIATISPSAAHVEETLNTLEYALRAKSIMNKPELNAQVSVNSLMQEYLEKISRLRQEIHDKGSKSGFFAPDEILSNWESTLKSTSEEKFELLSRIESVKEEEKALDLAIAEANNVLAEKQSQLEATKLEMEENRKELVTEENKLKLNEMMLQIIEAMYEDFHEELDKDLEEINILKSEEAKLKERLKNCDQEYKSMHEKIGDISEKRKLWHENFQQDSENLLNYIRNFNEKVFLTTSDLSTYVCTLQNEFEKRSDDCENEFQELSKALSDLEKKFNSFQENIAACLQEEKSAQQKSIDDFCDAYLASNEDSWFEEFNKAMSNCESSLQSLSSSLNDWKKDLKSETDASQQLIKEHIEKHSAAIESANACLKSLFSKQDENIDEYNGIVSECLNAHTANKKIWSEKFLAVEQSLSSVDLFATEFIDKEIDRTTQACSFLNNYSNTGMEVKDKLTTCCENAIKDMDTVQNELDLHGQNMVWKKLEDLKTIVNSSSSSYRNLNADLAKVRDGPKKFNDHSLFSDIKNTLKGKIDVCEQSKVIENVQIMTDSMTKCGDTCKTCITEHQKQIESSLSKGKMYLEKLVESSKKLPDMIESAIPRVTQAIETDLIKSLVRDDIEMTARNERTNFENTVLDMNTTVVSSATPELICSPYDCPICANKSADETLKTDFSIETPKPEQGTSEATGSKSLMSLFPQSPIRHPNPGPSNVPARKRLMFPDTTSLIRQLMEYSSEEES